MTILLGNGNGTLQPAVSYPAGASPTAVVVGDFNNDGKVDVAVANDLNPGTVSVMIGNGDGTLQAPLNYIAGRNPGQLAAGDFNGDGFVDLVAGNGDGFVTVINAADWPPLPISDGPRPFDLDHGSHQPAPIDTESYISNRLATVPADETTTAMPRRLKSAPRHIACIAAVFDALSMELN